MSCAPLFLLVLVPALVLGATATACALEVPPVPACPSSPNCVSSTQPDATSPRYIAPLELTGRYEYNAPAAMAEVARIVREMGGTVQDASPQRVHATFTSDFFGFVDDVYVAPGSAPAAHPDATTVLHVHSSSRTGYWDMGANRARVEDLRTRLAGRSGL